MAFRFSWLIFDLGLIPLAGDELVSSAFTRFQGGESPPTRFFSVSRHTHETDAGNLALRVEAEQKAGRVAAGKDKLYDVECLLSDRAGPQNLSTRRRRPVLVLLEIPRHCHARRHPQVGIVVGSQLRTVDLTRAHLGEPRKCQCFDAVLRRCAGRRRRGDKRGCGATCQKRSDQPNHNGEPHLRRSCLVFEIESRERAHDSARPFVLWLEPRLAAAADMQPLDLVL
jgi:hypothetical protein